MVTAADIINTLAQFPLVGPVLRWYSRQYKDGTVVRIPYGHAAGMKWRRHHRYVSGYWVGNYELALQQTLARELKSGNTFYDIGANAGFFSVLAAKLVGPTGHVFAFEPLPENIESIEAQICVNAIDYCKLVARAVADRSGTEFLTLAQNTSMGHISRANSELGDVGERMLAVQAVTLDDFVAANPWPDFIKVDVEGAEAEVLAGAARLLGAPAAPRFLIELHGHNCTTRVESILTSHGYHLMDLEGTRLRAGAAEQHRHILANPPTWPMPEERRA